LTHGRGPGPRWPPTSKMGLADFIDQDRTGDKNAGLRKAADGSFSRG